MEDTGKMGNAYKGKEVAIIGHGKRVRATAEPAFGYTVMKREEMKIGGIVVPDLSEARKAPGQDASKGGMFRAMVVNSHPQYVPDGSTVPIDSPFKPGDQVAPMPNTQMAPCGDIEDNHFMIATASITARVIHPPKREV